MDGSGSCDDSDEGSEFEKTISSNLQELQLKSQSRENNGSSGTDEFTNTNDTVMPPL
ncbi:hypothetical protein HDU99_000330 [Rhizoclosmatium hyalinum]|nr:hypothetical protein HDU99_000330 [Rhizoclosmatium hyalinum]